MLQEWRERAISVRVMALQTDKRLDRHPAQMALAKDSARSLKTNGQDGCPARPSRECAAGACVRPVWADRMRNGFLFLSHAASVTAGSPHHQCAAPAPPRR